MDNNNNNSNNNNNNNNNNNLGYISRMIRGITDTNSIRPAITPESIPSFLIQNRDTNKINNDNLNTNYNTSLKSTMPEESGPNFRESTSKNINSVNEGFNNNKLKKTEISFNDSDSNAKRINLPNEKAESSKSDSVLSSEKVTTKSRQPNIPINTVISNLNKSDDLSINLKTRNHDIINYKTRIMPERSLSKKNNIDFERILHSKYAINKLQKNPIVEKRTYEPTITINIGKITVRYIGNNNNSKNIKDMINETRNSNKLSLTDYLKKRAGTSRKDE